MSRVTTPVNVTLANVRTIKGLRDWEKNHEAVEAADNIINTKDWPKTMEAIVEYLRGNDGWATLQDEMINRAPIVNAANVRMDTFITDNQRTWVLISTICRESECWTYVKKGQRTRDGRLAFRSMYNHYLGPNAVDNMANSVERKLTRTTYEGEKKRWNFEKFTNVHMNAHHTLEGLTRYGYAGIDERSKVRYLIDGVKTPSLDAVKTRIMSDAALRGNFSGCVTLYRDMIEQQQTQEKKSLNISVTETEDKKDGGKKKKNGKGSISADQVEDRYYDSKEYAKLSDDAKLKLKRLRENRGTNPSGRIRTKDIIIFRIEELEHDETVQVYCMRILSTSRGICVFLITISMWNWSLTSTVYS